MVQVFGTCGLSRSESRLSGTYIFLCTAVGVGAEPQVLLMWMCEWERWVYFHVLALRAAGGPRHMCRSPSVEGERVGLRTEYGHKVNMTSE